MTPHASFDEQWEKINSFLLKPSMVIRTRKSLHTYWLLDNGPDEAAEVECFGKLANIFTDLPSKNIEDTGIFKALTGEDYLMGVRKNKNPFSFRSTARLLFSCNKIPKN